MRCIDFNVEYKKPETKINIVPLGDVHLGNVCADIEAFKKMVDYVNEKENTYTILMGDMIDVITHTDGHRYDVDTIDPIYNTPEKQINAIIDILTPLAKKKKIIAMLEGNHELTARKYNLIPAAERISSALGIPMLGVQGLIRFNCRRRNPIDGKIDTYTPHIFAHHGWGSGRRTGSIVNQVEDLSSWVDADIYLLGHSHKIYGNREVRLFALKTSSSNKTVYERKLVFGVTGTFLKSYTKNSTSSYIEQQGYRPNKIGCIKLVIIPYEKDIHVFT